MSYTRDPDHYTRGIGAVQAVDKVLANNRGRARRAQDAALESARRDRLKAKLMRPGLGMVALPTFGRVSSNMAPVMTAGGSESTSPNAATGNPGVFTSGTAGGGVSPTNGGLKGTTYSVALNAARAGVITPSSTTPVGVGKCVDASGNPIPCPTGPSWSSSTGVVPPVYAPPVPVYVPPTAGTTTGTSSGGVPPASNTDPGTVATSSVGVSSGGPSGLMTPITNADGSVDTDTTVLTPSGPDYKTYALYGGIALGALLLYRELTKKGR